MLEPLQKPPIGAKWRESAKEIIALGQYLTVMRRQMPWVDFERMVQADYGLNRSAVSKLIAIAEHPILSNPQYADKLPNAWALLYELRRVPDAVLIEKITDGSLQGMSKYDIWAIRGAERPAGSAARNRAGANLPPEASLVDLCRKGIAMERENPSPTDVTAKKLGIAYKSYSMIRKAILLLEKDISKDERSAVMDALGHIDRTRNVNRYYSRIEPIVERMWGPKQARSIEDKHSRKRVEAFKNSISILCISCERVTTIEQPRLSKDDVTHAVGELMGARQSINQLINNLRRTQNE